MRPILGKIQPTAETVNGTYRVDVWQERDRLSLSIEPGTDQDGQPIVEFEPVCWWDDDARALFDDGFVVSGDIAGSLVRHAASLGLIPADHV